MIVAVEAGLLPLLVVVPVPLEAAVGPPVPPRDDRARRVNRVTTVIHHVLVVHVDVLVGGVIVVVGVLDHSGHVRGSQPVTRDLLQGLDGAGERRHG